MIIFDKYFCLDSIISFTGIQTYNISIIFEPYSKNIYFFTEPSGKFKLSLLNVTLYLKSLYIGNT